MYTYFESSPIFNEFVGNFSIYTTDFLKMIKTFFLIFFKLFPYFIILFYMIFKDRLSAGTDLK